MKKTEINILFLENVNKCAVKKFTDAGFVVREISRALTENELIEEIKNVHVLGIRSKTRITQKVLEAATNLLAIGCFCIGVNQVDLQNACNKGIAVFNSPYGNTRSVAELVIGASIMLIRRIPDKNKAAHKGIWKKESKGCFELRGKTIGIIGYGNIGSQVSVLAESLGMNVVYFDVINKLPLGNARALSMEEVLKCSDIVTLHVPGDATTDKLINSETLKLFKSGSILINYARGNVVDVDALAQSLEDEDLSGAAVDVFPVEPTANGGNFECVLQNKNNVLLTPHIGGSTEEAQINIGIDVSNKLYDFLETGNTTESHSIPSLLLSAQENTHRILHIHRNVPGIMSDINSRLLKEDINVVAQYLKTNNSVGYVVLDIDKEVSSVVFDLLQDVRETIKVRLLY